MHNIKWSVFCGQWIYGKWTIFRETWLIYWNFKFAVLWYSILSFLKGVQLVDVKTAILHRRSIRRFSPEPVDSSLLIELVSLARLYASGGNLQPVRFSIQSSPSYLNQLFQLLHWAAYLPDFHISVEEQPPAYIILLRDTKISHACPFEIGAAATTLMLAAQEHGLATCCIGNFSAKSLSALLSIPAEYVPELVIAIGYPAQASATEDLTDSVRYAEDNHGNMLVPKYRLEDILIDLPPVSHSLLHGGRNNACTKPF